MSKNFSKTIFLLSIGILVSIIFCNCKDSNSKSTVQSKNAKVYPSDVMPFMDEFKILLGDGTASEELVNYQQKDFFYTTNDGKTDWVVYKTPNAGVTSRTSSNTRTELGQLKHWTPETGGKLTGTLKVMHVSTSGDARVAAAYSVVVGQIHSDEGHENEPLKIFYKKFSGHKKGSVYWNYEINTEGDNSKRWDYSTAVWGHDMSVIGTAATAYPAEPADGIELGEEFGYEINVYKGIMHLSFTSAGHTAKRFTKSLVSSEYLADSAIPQQIRTLYAVIDRDGTEQPTAYAGEKQYFKQGAYNQANGKAPSSNMVWSTGSEIYEGGLAKQYANGSYTEVWFKEGSVGAGTQPIK